MFGRRKPLPEIKALLVAAYNRDEHWTREYKVPPKGTWSQGFRTDLSIRHANGQIDRTVRFQAGFTVEVSPIYEEE